MEVWIVVRLAPTGLFEPNKSPVREHAVSNIRMTLVMIKSDMPIAPLSRCVSRKCRSIYGAILL